MGTFGNGDHTPATPDDFDNVEDWIEYCRTGGELPFDRDKGFRGYVNPGYHGSIVNGIYGHTYRDFQHALMDYGVSTQIKPTQYERNGRAVMMANCIYGKVLNTTIDINWATLGITNDFEIARVNREFRELLRHWLTHRDVQVLYVWVMERGKSVGPLRAGPLHTHIMVHIPPELAIKQWAELKLMRGLKRPNMSKVQLFRAIAERWLEQITRKTLLRTPKSKTMRIRHRSRETTSHQWFAFKYRHKGLGGGKEEALERYGLHLVSDQGSMAVKRTGVSRLLDHARYAEISAMNYLPSFDMGVPGDRPYDDRYLIWYRENWATLIMPVTTPNGNRKGRSYIFGPESGVEPLDIEEALRNGRVSFPPAVETDWRFTKH